MKIFHFLLLSCLGITILSCQSAEKQEKTNLSSENTEKVVETPAEETTSQDSKKQIVFFGNSLTAAYGVDPEEGFTSIIQEKINTLELPYNVVNAGNSGETTAGGEARVEWILKQEVDIFVLELGGNDGLRGIDPDASYRNLQSIIKKVKAKNPSVQILLAGMQAPPNMGPDFTQKFAEMYPRLAEENNTQLIPFLLENVGGIADLNLADGIHPTPDGHKILAENVWKVLKGML